MREEIGLQPTDYSVVEKRGPYRYEFRPGFRKEGCDGQEQTYFLAMAKEGAADRICVDRQEFGAFRWVMPSEFLIDWVPPIKRGVYRAVFRDFFGVEIA